MLSLMSFYSDICECNSHYFIPLAVRMFHALILIKIIIGRQSPVLPLSDVLQGKFGTEASRKLANVRQGTIRMMAHCVLLNIFRLGAVFCNVGAGVLAIH